MRPAPDLRVDIGGMVLKNPVMTASGTFGYGLEFAPLVDLDQLGAMVVKGLSLDPAKGNPPPRIVETPCGMLNAIGLENVGVETFVSQKLPLLPWSRTPVIANIYGPTVADYGRLAQRLDPVAGVAAIEVNISCPNVKAGGVVFGIDPDAAGRVVRTVCDATAKPVIVKLSPNVTDITEIAQAAVAAGAGALSLINTITGMAVDIHTRRPRLANITGGLSGPAIRPVALRMVWQVARAVSVPVIGIGGIMNAEDALEFFIAGATAVQIGTANFVNPRTAVEVVDGIATYLSDHGLSTMADIIGTLETPSPGE